MNEDTSYTYGDEPWARIINGILMSIAENRIHGNISEMVNGVKTLSTYMNPYKDDGYHIEMQKLNEKTRNHQIKKEDYNEQWLKALIDLYHRSGFLPIPRIEAILDVKDLKE